MKHNKQKTWKQGRFMNRQT